MFGTIGGIEQSLGARVEGAGVVTEQDLAQPLADGGVAWLERGDDLVSFAGQRLGEQAHLGALARAFSAFEGNEETRR